MEKGECDVVWSSVGQCEAVWGSVFYYPHQSLCWVTFYHYYNLHYRMPRTKGLNKEQILELVSGNVHKGRGKK